MELTFLGAAGEVTGSCYLLRVGGTRVLIDAGMFQGSADADRKNREPLPVDLRLIDAVVLTHAHLDHSGRLPALVKQGYRKRVYCTPSTVALCDILLKDAARLQADEAARARRKHAAGTNGLAGAGGEPLFGEEDVNELLRRMSVVRCNQAVAIAPGVSLRYVDAGHILGSGSVELTCEENGKARTVVFSGDIGERGMPIMHDPTTLTKADVLVLESTYGNRDHKPLAQTQQELLDAVRAGIDQRGMILMPAFAIGRTQTLIYELHEFIAAKAIPPIPVVLDSPMGAAVTRLYETHKEMFDDDAIKLLREGCNPLRIPGMRVTGTADESRALNDLQGPAIIIAGAGMCNGGRIQHHLRHRLYKKNTHVVIAGFQAEGTLGRRLVNREKVVRIFGEPVSVEATIHTIGGLSAHAGQTTLVEWAGKMSGTRPRVFLTHGEDPQRRALAEVLRARWKMECTLPVLGDSADV